MVLDITSDEKKRGRRRAQAVARLGLISQSGVKVELVVGVDMSPSFLQCRIGERRVCCSTQLIPPTLPRKKELC